MHQDKFYSESDRKRFFSRVRSSFSKQLDKKILSKERELVKKVKSMCSAYFNGEDTVDELILAVEDRLDESYIKIIDIIEQSGR